MKKNKTKSAPVVVRPAGPSAAPELIFAFKDAKRAAECARILADAPNLGNEAWAQAQVEAEDAAKRLKKAAKRLEQSVVDHAQLNAALGRAAH